MQNFVKIASVGRLNFVNRCSFSDIWKDRDEASEKVYISRA